MAMRFDRLNQLIGVMQKGKATMVHRIHAEVFRGKEFLRDVRPALEAAVLLAQFVSHENPIKNYLILGGGNIRTKHSHLDLL